MQDPVGASDQRRGEGSVAEFIPIGFAVATIAWLGGIVVRPFDGSRILASERAKLIAMSIGSPWMGFLVLATVLAALFVPSTSSSSASLRARRLATALGAFASLFVIAGALWTVWTTAIDVHIPGNNLNDSFRVSFSRVQISTAERISTVLHGSATLVLASLAFALAVQLLRLHPLAVKNANDTESASADQPTDEPTA